MRAGWSIVVERATVSENVEVKGRGVRGRKRKLKGEIGEIGREGEEEVKG